MVHLEEVIITQWCHNELDGRWREYNDTHVRDVSEDELLRQKPYCLFYRRL